MAHISSRLDHSVTLLQTQQDTEINRWGPTESAPGKGVIHLVLYKADAVTRSRTRLTEPSIIACDDISPSSAGPVFLKVSHKHTHTHIFSDTQLCGSTGRLLSSPLPPAPPPVVFSAASTTTTTPPFLALDRMSAGPLYVLSGILLYLDIPLKTDTTQHPES